MEGIDAYAFHQELNHQTSMNNPKSRILETISSWLDLDLPNTPSFPQELQDLQMLDEHFFQFTTSTTTHHHNIDYAEPLPNLPRPDSPFILDLHEFDINPPPPPPNHSTEKTTTTPEFYQPTLPDHDDDDDECETYLNVMAESPESVGGVDQFFQSDDHDHIHENFNIMSNSSSTTTTTDKVVDQNKKQKQLQKQQSSDHTTVDQDQDQDDDEDQEDQEIEDEPKGRGTLNCKNLVSERNRRKRLSQQLLALRALVPNITKMDKRSVLVDALSYLKSMQEETARIQKELKENQQSKQQHHHQTQAAGFMSETCLIHDESPGSNRIPRILANTAASKPKPQIIEIDIEKIEDKRFIVKITCKGANNVGGDVLRVIESLGFEITYAALDQIKPQHILTTIFIRVKKQEKMTEEKLKDCIISSALRSGLTLQSC